MGAKFLDGLASTGYYVAAVVMAFKGNWNAAIFLAIMALHHDNAALHKVDR
jgi:hypothetical protein